MLARSMRRCATASARRWMASSRQSRTFLTAPTLSSYWMKRAKILHIIGRMVVAYPQMHYIPDPDAPINDMFAPGAGERERAFMFVLSQIPPDEPIELAEFLRGASHAAETIVSAIYEADDATLEALALPECVSAWKEKNRQLRRVVGASDSASVRLERLEIQHAGLAEVNYTYSDAKREDEAAEDVDSEATKQDPEPSTPPSKFLMHEAMQIKVQFDVREHVRVIDVDERDVAVASTFEWTFESDVSRAESVDWVITSVSPFSSSIAPNDDCVHEITKDIEEKL